jgi:N-acylglucosamine 2-epimerase
VHDLSFKHYPVPEHGEWTQKLDRQFRKITDVVALPVKDPFHLPRAIMLCVESLARMK